ncbi:MAG: hypothetical protein IPN79_00990 [Saprospiraceae bacterium]|nr:hypothetical protein [Saprospiraceae bacterium]
MRSFSFLLFFIIGFYFIPNFVNGQCPTYQVYESFSTSLPTQGGTWFNNGVVYSSNNPRSGARTMAFNGTGDFLRTPLLSNPKVFSFWYRRSSATDAFSLIVEYSSDDVTYTNLATLSSFTTTYQQYSVDLEALSLTNIYIRLRDNRASGSAERYIDDLAWTSTNVNQNLTIVPALGTNMCTASVICGQTYKVFDNGGVSDQYNSSQNNTIILAPGTSGQAIQLTVNSCVTESSSSCDDWDWLKIFEGNSITNTLLHWIQTGCATRPVPSGTVTSSDPNGNLTLQFKSDSGINAAGFEVTIICVPQVTCFVPSGANVNNVTNNSATINWTEPAPPAGVGYEWEVRTSGAGGSGPTGLAASGNVSTGMTMANVSSLSSNTMYTAFVRSDCGAGDYSVWSTGVVFTTRCDPAVIPYDEGFESAVVPAYPVCVTGVNTPTRSTTTTGAQPRTGTKYINVRWTPTSTKYLYSAPVGLTTGVAYDFGFWYLTDGISGWTSIKLLVNNQPSATGATQLGIVNNATNTTYQELKGIYTPSSTGSYYLIVEVVHTSSPNDMSIDDIYIYEAPSCLTPTAINVNSITSNSANINWTEPAPPAGVGYEWEVRTSGAAGSGPTGLVASGSVATGITMASVSGLTGNTMYTAYVRSDCGAGDFSNWSTGVGFTTSCDAANIPYTQDFESATIPNMPACTSRENAGTGNQWVTANNPGNGFTTRCLQYGYDDTNPANAWFYTQGLNLTGGVTYRLTFNYGNNSTSFIEKLKVAYGSTPVNGSMTTQLLDFPTINQGALQNATVDFTPASTGVYYLGFNCYSAADQFNLYVDNISLALAPTDAVDWGNLQWPENGTIFPQNTYVSYGQAWEPGVTDMTGQGAGLNAWVGWSNSNTDPATWPTGNWISAPFNVDAGNNDEFSGTFPANTFTPGTYYYAYRYQLNGGPFRYGAYSAGGGGFWNGTSFVNGVLTVNACPSITPTATPSSICVGESSDLNVTSPNGNYTYLWNPGMLAGATQTVSPVATTQYTVTATDNATGCVLTSNVTVTVNPLPVSRISPDSPISISCGDVQQLTTGILDLNTSTSDYIFTSSAGAFTPLSGGTALDAIEADDAISATIPIGFSFRFNGVNYSNIKVSSNGFITFNTTASTSAPDNSSAVASSFLPLIAPLWDDLAGSVTSSSAASYQLTGTSPDRVLTIEWLNWEWNYTATEAVISMQVKLYETTNKVEFNYRQEAGSVVPGTTGGASIGIMASSSNYLMLNGSGANPLASNSTFTTNITTKPATGQVYSFALDVITPTTSLWSGPSGTLWQDMAATMPYTGQNLATVYAKPTTSGTNTYTVTVTDVNGCEDTESKDVEVGSCAIALNTKVFLTNVSSGIMSDVLRTLPDFPLTDPYTTAPYTTSGLFTFVPAQTPATTTQTILDNNNVVDWVFVELRSGTSGSTTVTASKSGLLKNDGVIINPDGTPFSFSGVAAGNYFIAIKHRNHCGFMTNGTIVVPNPSLLNLTNGSVTLYQNQNPL